MNRFSVDGSLSASVLGGESIPGRNCWKASLDAVTGAAVLVTLSKLTSPYRLSFTLAGDFLLFLCLRSSPPEADPE